MTIDQETKNLLRALKLPEDQTLLLPDPGEGNAMVVMRYKGVELAYIIRSEHFYHDECVSAPLLKMRDCFKIVTELPKSQIGAI